MIRLNKNVMTKFNLAIIALVLILSGCGEKPFVINGTLLDADPGSFVYLDRLGSNNMDNVDSVALDESGKFTLSYKSTSPAFYLLRVSNYSFLTAMIEPGEKITIKAKADSLLTDTARRIARDNPHGKL